MSVRDSVVEKVLNKKSVASNSDHPNPMKVGFLKVNENGSLLDLDQQATEILDLRREDALESGWLMVIHPEDKSLIKNFWSKTKEVEAICFTCRFIRRNEEVIWGHFEGIWSSSKNYYECVLINTSPYHKIYESYLDTTEKLEEKKLVFKELIGQAELEKKATQDAVLTNVEQIILPIIHKLRDSGAEQDQRSLELIQKNLEKLTSSFTKRITTKLSHLTPREIQICNMIRSGMSNKEIARVQSVSPLTVHTHRNRIRKKLGLANKKINLVNYLRTL